MLQQVAKRPPLGRKKVIAAVLATPVAQDATSAPDSSTGAAKQDVRAPPKVPAKKAVAKAAATKPVDQDLLQVLMCSAAPFTFIQAPQLSNSHVHLAA